MTCFSHFRHCSFIYFYPFQKFCTKCRSQEKRLERTYTKLRKLEAALEKILRWQTEKEKELAAAPPISSEPHIIKEQLEQVRSLRAIVDGCESHITTANELARSLISKGKPGTAETVPPLKLKLEKINEGWRRMDAKITGRLYDLDSALKKSQGIEKALEDIRRWIEEREGLLAVKDPVVIKHDELQDQLSKYSVSLNSLARPPLVPLGPHVMPLPPHPILQHILFNS